MAGSEGETVKTPKISETVVRRLPLYLRYLNELNNRGVTTVSSQELGAKLDLNPAQIRKDLACFGEFGKKGIGYDVKFLVGKIREILKLNRTIFVALVGAGNLGHALCNYNQYLQDNLKIIAVFDNAPEKVGLRINNLQVQPMGELVETIRRLGIRIGIITVPASEAQSVADHFVEAGVEAILNFAPTIIRTPSHVRVHHADFTMELQSLAYYLNQEGGS